MKINVFGGKFQTTYSYSYTVDLQLIPTNLLKIFLKQRVIRVVCVPFPV